MIGIEGLSNATTDHTTLLNWMIEAGLFRREARSNPLPDEAVMKAALGISASERSSFAELPLTPMAKKLLADSWRVVPDLIEMLHLTLAGARNIEIRWQRCGPAQVGRSQRLRWSASPH